MSNENQQHTYYGEIRNYLSGYFYLESNIIIMLVCCNFGSSQVKKMASSIRFENHEVW